MGCIKDRLLFRVYIGSCTVRVGKMYYNCKCIATIPCSIFLVELSVVYSLFLCPLECSLIEVK